MNIFTSDDYRKILAKTLEEKKFLDKKYTYHRMADHMRIQKPYISKVINNRADFSSDQLYMACDYLGIDGEEREYMLLLLEHERSLYAERKQELRARIEAIQDLKRDASQQVLKNIKKMSADEFDNSLYIDYYLDPIVLVVHIFLTIKKFRQRPEAICDELQISKEHLSDILGKLDKMKLIEVKAEKINLLVSTMHLPKDSQIVGAHHQLLHQLGILRKNRVPINKKKNFYVTFASDEKSRKKIEEEFNIFIGKVRELAMSGSQKECYQLNFDLFPWSSANS